MEVESFEEEGVAKLLNDGFVSIKVRSFILVSDYFSNLVTSPCCATATVMCIASLADYVCKTG